MLAGSQRLFSGVPKGRKWTIAWLYAKISAILKANPLSKMPFEKKIKVDLFESW